MEDTTYDTNRLEFMREQLEKMSHFNQVEALRIIARNKNVTINENRYGSHINLSELDYILLNELSQYIKYVNTQEQYLNSAEQEKEKYKSTYFVKDNKDNAT
jgi:hypothetical protein